jgi:hypothetical protein
MKILTTTLLFITLLGQGNVLAHSDHSVISGQTALSIASKTAKQLTFKDFGFEVGKLDASWKELKDSNYSVVEVLEDSYIISAKNTVNENTIFFRIAKNGQILNIKNSNEF